MNYSEQEGIVRGLARELAGIAALPDNARKRRKWADHNELHGEGGALLWVCIDEDGGWLELLPESAIQSEDAELRTLERRLRQQIYQHTHFDDDFVYEPLLRFDMPGEYTGYLYGDAVQKNAWGIDIEAKAVGKGAYHLDNYLSDEANLEKLLAHEVDFIPDQEETRRLRGKYESALGGFLELQLVIPYCALVQSLLIDLVHLRGMSELMLDLYDNPEMLHRVMDHMSASKVRLLDRLEAKGLLFDNHTNIYTGSGGLGYTNRRLDPRHLAISELWGFADSQEFSNVSTSMFEDFALQYQKRGLNRFGLACYGCCEPLDARYESIFREIPNIRRLSVSPWSSVPLAAEAIGDRAILSWKPNPVLCMGFDRELMERDLAEVARATRNNTTEIILKDVRTCSGTPSHVKKFVGLVRKHFC
ncbi:MAG: hypothetical protein WCQ50_07280 [Spirochaetota bacterium]